MEYEVLISFAGPEVFGARGKIIVIKDKALAKDFLDAGYIRPVKPVKQNTRAKGKEKL